MGIIAAKAFPITQGVYHLHHLIDTLSQDHVHMLSALAGQINSGGLEHQIYGVGPFCELLQ